MPLLDFLKRKKEKEKEREKEKEKEVSQKQRLRERKEEKREEERKEEKRKERKRKEKKEERSEVIKKIEKKKERLEADKILKALHITEKATDLSKSNQYVFRVWPEANKPQIKRAIKELYGVNVISVRIINVPPKRRRLGRIRGWKKGFKKAIVRIKEGEKIEISSH